MKQYVTPATQEQSMTMCQLMAGSGIPKMGVNTNPLSGSSEEIIFGG